MFARGGCVAFVAFVALVALVALVQMASAEPYDGGPARSFSRDSTTVFVASELAPLQTVAIRVEVDGGARWHRRSWALETRLGIGFSASGAANGTLLGLRAGASIGRSLPIACRIALTPMIAGDVFAYRESDATSTFTIPRLTVELPVSIVLYPHVVLEPVLQLGVQWVSGARDVAIVVGPRIGIVL